METTSNTQAHQPTNGLIATIGVIYGFTVSLAVFLIVRNISILRTKALRKLSTRLQDKIFIQNTLQALIIVVPSLLWPLFLIPILFAIADHRLTPEDQRDRGLERGASNSDSDSSSSSDSVMESDELLLRRETNDTLDSRGAAPPYVHSPPYVARAPSMPSAAFVRSPSRGNTTEPPPAYAPYPTVLATLQTQWLEISDRRAESYIRLLNNVDATTPPETMIQLSRATIFPPRR